MQIVTAILACILATGAARAASAPALPNKAAGLWGRDGIDCRDFGYVEGPSHCDWLQALGEPTWPVTDADTKLAVRMIWGVGDRNSTATVRFEIQSTDSGTLWVHEGTGLEPRYHWLDAMVRLTSKEIVDLLAAEQAADIWSKPYDLPSLVPKGPPKDGGIETVFLCYDYLTIVEAREGNSKVVEGACADPAPNKDVLAYARTMMSIAQHHFPDFAKTQLWREELKEN
jgi:hypothetical protein